MKDGNLLYVDNAGTTQQVPLEAASLLIVDHSNSDDDSISSSLKRGVAIEYTHPVTQQRCKIVIDASNRDEEDRVLEAIQTHIDFMPTHRAGWSTRYGRALSLVAAYYRSHFTVFSYAWHQDV